MVPSSWWGLDLSFGIAGGRLQEYYAQPQAAALPQSRQLLSQRHKDTKNKKNNRALKARNVAVAREAAPHWGAALPAFDPGCAYALAGAGWPGL